MPLHGLLEARPPGGSRSIDGSRRRDARVRRNAVARNAAHGGAETLDVKLMRQAGLRVVGVADTS